MVIALDNHWIEIKDGDPRAVAIYRRHYSCRNPEVDYCRYGFSGKGESMVLITPECNALWCWRRVEGEGVNCSVFRNEGDILSSQLVIEASGLARKKWGNKRLYTYVNSQKIQSSNPGYCFLMAGWEKCGKSKGGLDILEYNFTDYET